MSEQSKNRELKEQSILEAVGRIFLRDGFSGIGINTIAAEAGCNKVLIYRYFGGLDGVLERFAHQFRLISPVATDNDAPLADRAELILKDQVTRLRSNPLLREIMKWELVDTNPLTEAMAQEREATGISLVESLQVDSDEDIAAWAAIISAGINYLSIRSDTTSDFCGIPIDSDEGWERIQKAIHSLVNKLSLPEEL